MFIIAVSKIIDINRCKIYAYLSNTFLTKETESVLIFTHCVFSKKKLKGIVRMSIGYITAAKSVTAANANP